MDQRVLKVIALMKAALHSDWSGVRLAKCVNLSASRLHQLFKEETGLPPARYLRSLRMQRAREFLETSNLSVKQVMARVGATDESHFLRDFKKTYGFTPARYRERFLGGLLNEGTTKPAPPSSIPAHSGARTLLKQPAPASSAASVTAPAPPLLLRRRSHPHQLKPNKFSLIRKLKRAELLSLLILRHAAFAELTTAISSHLIGSVPPSRAINYRPRRSATSRRLPPSAERPQALSLRPPRCFASRSLPCSPVARRKD